MKIKTEHYQHMKEEILKLALTDIEKHAVAVKNSGKFNDFGKRMRWDIAHAVALDRFFCTEIYPYANDDHIDTALKQIVKEIGLSF